MIHFSPSEQHIFSQLDDLQELSQIVSNLPLDKPIAGDDQSPFGHRIDPFTGHLAFHSGLDIAGPYGGKVHSTADGVVVAAGWNGSYGNAVDIDHGFGIVTRYGHLSAILVHVGDHVHHGSVIGEEGSTGRSTGPHVHYEVRYNDQPMNPKNFIGAGNEISQE
jgi:murein DD-endopeptidase MepM/ murein hydrolase activator NlpD